MAVHVGKSPADTAATLLYEVPVGRHAVMTVNVVTTIRCRVKIGLTAGAAPTDADWIENLELLPASVLERGGIALPAGHKIFVQTSVANAMNAKAWGVDEKEPV